MTKFESLIPNLKLDIRDDFLYVTTPSFSGRIERSEFIFVNYFDSILDIAAMIFPHNSSCIISREKDRKLVRFQLNGFAKKVAEAISEFAGLDSTCLKALVVVNPIAGRGRGKRDWEKIVEPLMRASNRFDITSAITESKGHAGRIVQNFLATNTEGPLMIVAVGGDGLVFEILSGIHECSNWQEVLKRVILAPVPSGSANGLAFSCLTGDPFTMNCVLRQLIRAKFGRKDLGIASHENSFGETTSKLFSLSLSWGLIADVDIESEFLRCWFGNSRFTLYGIYRILKRIKYSAIFLNDDTTEIEPNYLTFFASLVPVAGKTFIIDPEKKLNSHTFSVYKFLSSDFTRSSLVSAISELEKNRNHQPYIPSFVPIESTEFELVPDSTKIGAGIVIDGEPLTRGPVRVRILPAATNCLIG